MVTLDGNLMEKFQAGMISREEVINKSQDPGTVMQKLAEWDEAQAEIGRGATRRAGRLNDACHQTHAQTKQDSCHLQIFGMGKLHPCAMRDRKTSSSDDDTVRSQQCKEQCKERSSPSPVTVTFGARRHIRKIQPRAREAKWNPSPLAAQNEVPSGQLMKIEVSTPHHPGAIRSTQ